jgi:MFS family permease
MLAWLTNDGKLLLLSRALRSFAYGFLSVVLAIYLKLIGIQELEIGIILTATLVGSAIFTFFASIYVDRMGRRKTLVLLGALMAISGLIFALTTNYTFLLIAALIGTINVTGTEVGAFLSIEQAVLPQTCPQKKRTIAFSLYSTSSTLAVASGALLGGLPEILQISLLIPASDSFRPLFLLYSVIAILTTLIYLSLSKRIELIHKELNSNPYQLLRPESKSRVFKLASLFAIDSFAGGFVLQSIVAFWFFTRFGISLGTVSLIFFAANILTAISFLIAARIAAKIGLINTMVFTHIASNVFLIIVPVAPTLPLALIFYLARMSLSQMDVPTRQSYTVAIVNPKERTAAAGLTNISRNVSQVVSPSIAGYILQFISLSSPFFLGGGLKIIYDLLLYSSFRKIKPPEEIEEAP